MLTFKDLLIATKYIFWAICGTVLVFFIIFKILICERCTDNKLSTLRIENKDEDLISIRVEICEMSQFYSGKIQKIVIKFYICHGESDYALALTYKDGKTIQENRGYVTGGRTSDDTILISDRKIELIN